MIQTKNNWPWQKIWLAAYAVGLTLIPPCVTHGKNIFPGEWLLLPVVIVFFSKVFKGQTKRPPAPLILVIVALVVAFLAGLMRGEIGHDLTIYWMGESDKFTFLGDFIPFCRWTMIFATPWIVGEVCRGKKLQASVFLDIFKYSVFISALMAWADHWEFINLLQLGYHQISKVDGWDGRSFGTFTSPLDASLVYSLTIVYIITGFGKKFNVQTAMDLVIASVCFSALLLTHGGTAVFGVILTLVIFILKTRLQNPRQRYFLLASLVGAAVLGLALIPNPILVSKWNNFVIRFGTWFKWLSILPQKPWMLFVGIGFSGLIVDNSIVLLLIKGGLFLLLSVGLWMKKLYDFVPGNLIYILLFWSLSWLTLDSIGFWGSGRAMWIVLGLTYSNFLTDSAE